MKKLFSFLKKYKLVILIVLVISTFLYNYFSEKKEQTDQISNQNVTPGQLLKGVSYKSVVPGIDNEQKLRDNLGEVVKETEENGEKILEFKSTSEYRNHVAVVQEDKVKIIKEMINYKDNRNSSEIIEKYGDPLYVLYNNNTNDPFFKLYVYPDKGIAFLGHNDGTMLEIWYFQPQDIQLLLNTWASDYSSDEVTLPQD